MPDRWATTSRPESGPVAANATAAISQQRRMPPGEERMPNLTGLGLGLHSVRAKDAFRVSEAA
jgi:hypothetical protein